MHKLSIHSGGCKGCLGLSLRGSCTSPADAHQLAQTIQQFFTTHTSQLWIDCQQLQSLSSGGQDAIMRADAQARAAGISCCWCGLAAPLRAALQQKATAATQQLRLLPASHFEGPRFLLASEASHRALPID